jgi:hypothetical protein
MLSIWNEKHLLTMKIMTTTEKLAEKNKNFRDLAWCVLWQAIK